ncbi:protein-L-isoaspartate(D-aspartate) O-methyltransferase [Halosegnis longus]|uniref:Protein-L-isoaspartate O-methyltransferase n=1 Tax=Halosegnis longus TaxID=2216012 RepID=A0AAJ4UWR3_9EURY|nr:protein-L-isoaspartate(D-aspartate) O-methyltransferase [Salella cibi]RNJ27396.1 protein-L-isoaspartate(D-aspartate) O-methyltransferase [Salella cibi]
MGEYATERARLRERLAARTDASDRVLDAVERVPRHEFVSDARASEAYADRPLPIGDDQTISAPHMVAVMCDLLAPEPGDAVLEIGTGCGYHAAVMAELGADVFSVEYHDSLADEARARLARLGYDVRVRQGDGREGWPDHAPYDAAYLTCAASEIPGAVLDQTRPGGTVVAPVGRGSQRLTAVTVGEDGEIRDRTDHGGVRFVPLL